MDQPTCIAVAHFDGRWYHRQNAQVHPVPGEVLGEARIPGCSDTSLSQPPDVFVNVARLPGVDPSIAVVSVDAPVYVFVRASLEDLPPEVMAYLVAPGCEQGNGPIELEGQWLGIIQADGTTEIDMVPPYDVFMLVRRSSSQSYVRAELSIRVGPSLGTPLTRDDLDTALPDGESLRVVAECDGEEFVAREITLTLD